MKGMLIKMNRNTLNYWIDIGMALSFFVCFVTGVLKFRLFVRWLGLHQRELPIYELTVVHDWSGILLGVFVFAHLVLHWKWIVAMTRGFFKR